MCDVDGLDHGTRRGQVALLDYNRAMGLHHAAASEIPHAFDGDPFAGQSVDDRARIEAEMAASLTESTRAVYRNAWRAWERW